ncbi:hypothetical protein DTX80_16465 [Bacilli bacterium]|nr:hypothetical protein DEJ64_16920 [Bacilli bacterium]PZD83516.1 hypothetical protein DEJ60_16850 [Bacilli bacterium]PZD85256.1 hypothetical protein DEJ66_17015 [Bacilli bacterium]RCO04518.1 hypothetical protein DTX80_16465 [Bacilli bacterium]RCO07707.1 hypothetical protein DTX79_19135 [Bacilli bacterium]
MVDKPSNFIGRLLIMVFNGRNVNTSLFNL